MTWLHRFTLQVVALAVFALGLIWMSGSGVAVQSASPEAEQVYNKLHSDLANLDGRMLADTIKIETDETGQLQTPSETEDARENLFKNIKLFNAMAYNIKNRYMEDIDSKKLIRAGIRGMLQDLDPFSVLMEEDSHNRLMESTSGKYEGLGMQIDSRDDHIRIISPIEGTPAYSIGLQAGDVIWEINGKSTLGMTTEDAAGQMRGPAGTVVKLKIKRQGVPDYLDYELKRAVIELKSVNYFGYIDNSNIGYIRLSRFAETTGKELKDAIAGLRAQKQLDGVVFDLRSNGGGLLQEAVETSNLFLDTNKLIVYTRGRTPDSEQRYFATDLPMIPSGRLVVLVDEGTASASEIVAGAIQDWDRGIIMGQPTYGKGLVQQVFPAAGDPTVWLKLTTAKYYIPSGRCIQRPEHSKKQAMLDEEGLLIDQPADSADTMNVTKREVFFTNGGRTVFGGGGVVPDVDVESKKWNPIEVNLERQAIFFDFAVKYNAAHPEVDRNFTVTDQVLDEFKAYLRERDFDYKTSLEVSLDKMKEVVEDEGKDSLFAGSLANLAALVEKEKDADFEKSKDYIRQSIKRELMAKLYGQRGLYEEIILKTDPAVRRAFDLMSNDSDYTQIIQKGLKDTAKL